MKQQSKETVLVLANAITLVTGIVSHLSGSQIANTLSGSRVTQSAMSDLVASHLQKRLGYAAPFLNRKD